MTLQTLPTPRAEGQAAIVERLEELLARAKAGDLESLVWFAEASGSARVSWGKSGNVSTTRVVGRLEVLKHELVADFLADAEAAP